MSISELNFSGRSLLFAKLSQISYLDDNEASVAAADLGFNTIEFYNKDGAQAYRFENREDCVIACRGTQPKEFNDIKADLTAIPIMAETVSLVHKGFKGEVDELWPDILEDIRKSEQKLWFCGHSLGAAMATIMASRCHLYEGIPNVEELYTYGSPRVGWPKYVDSLAVKHHRWVNNNDIVTRVPLRIMGYRHHGELHYLNTWGNVRNPTGWQLVKDKLRGMWRGLKQGKIDNFGDHSMVNYVEHLDKYDRGMETPQI